MSVSITNNNRKSSALLRQLCDVSVADLCNDSMEMDLASGSLD